MDATARLARPFYMVFFPWLSEEAAHVLNVAIRKGAHVAQFLIFVLLLSKAMPQASLGACTWRARAAWILGASLALALASEGIQLFYPQREASLMDVTLDLLGAVAGLACLRLWELWHQKHTCR